MTRTQLLSLAAAGALATTCMAPRSDMLREDVHHLRTHTDLSARYGPACLPERLPADKRTEAPRPDPDDATHTFVGDVFGMREHVFLHQEGDLHSYAERWDVGIPTLSWEIMNVGWDWKISCRIRQCVLPDGLACCYQECADGGASGMAYEAPDRFGCMNDAAGGVFQWFLDGLHGAGVPDLHGCGAPPRAMRR